MKQSHAWNIQYLKLYLSLILLHLRLTNDSNAVRAMSGVATHNRKLDIYLRCPLFRKKYTYGKRLIRNIDIQTHQHPGNVVPMFHDMI